MDIILIDKENIVCKICDRKFGNFNGLSQHLKHHNTNSKEYTKTYLLENAIPQCLCGCGNNVNIKSFRYAECNRGHNPNSCWQNTRDRDSVEYKKSIDKMSNSLKLKYLKDGPRLKTDEEKRKQSEYMKKLLSDSEEKKRRHDKMIKTKHKQSKDGTLSKRHYVNNKSEEEVNEIYRRISKKASQTKKKRYNNGELTQWNKGLTVDNDERIKKWSGENNYRYSSTDINDERRKYTKKFKNKIFRNQILLEQNSCCFWCKKEPIKSMCLHHLDEDKANDSWDNLIFLCRSCHIKIHSIPKFNKELKLNVEQFKKQLGK